ncbi:MAG: (5-formylfuran-3-yl)methyl phosphate synthase, partial [Gemmatimonadaceae bacterium]
ALAGRITTEDRAVAYEAGAEVGGVRGAACEAGRNGRVRETRVRELLAARDHLGVRRGDAYAMARELTRETSFR